MTAELKDWIQICVWVVGIAGGLVAAAKAIAEMRRSNLERFEDMRWRRAEMARKCLDEMLGDRLICAALKMLDWSGLTYDIPDVGKSSAITDDQRRLALRTTDTIFQGDEPFIRHAFDALFDAFERIEHFLNIQLVVFDDVREPLAYYVGKLSRPEEYDVTRLFLETYHFQAAHHFLDRFPEWRAGR